MYPGGPGGRNKKMTSGGGNAYKRGSGLGAGPVGGGGRPSGSSSSGSSGRSGGTRGTGGSLLTVLAALLIGKAASSGSSSNGGSNGSKSGCLKRIIIIVIVVVVVLFLVRMCQSGGTVSDLLNGGADSLLGSGTSNTESLGYDDEDAGFAAGQRDVEYGIARV